MQVLAVLMVVFAAAQAGLLPGTTLVRTPSLDSAVIKSDRLGGNFAYSSVEGHAYAAVSPVVQNVVSPVGVSYSATPFAAPIAAPLHATYAAAPLHATYAAAPLHATYAAAPLHATYAAAAPLHATYAASPLGVRLGW